MHHLLIYVLCPCVECYICARVTRYIILCISVGQCCVCAGIRFGCLVERSEACDSPTTRACTDDASIKSTQVGYSLCPALSRVCARTRVRIL